MFLTDSRPAKNENTLLVGRWPAKSFFEKGRLTDHEFIRTIHLFELFDLGQRDYLNLKKKGGQKETNIAPILLSREALKNNYSQTAPKKPTPTTSDAAKLTKSNQILVGLGFG